ncbi:MAG: hypothetical protein Q8J63_07600 [Candidatus Aquicultor sp.]|nr:hypothetical protein [Candidatus Aquicultor sp.]
MNNKRFVFSLLITALFVLLIPAIAQANSMYLGSSGLPLKTKESASITLERQVMQVWLRYGYAEVENVYQFHNSGEAQTFFIGLPEEINTKDQLKYGVYNFSAYIDGESVDVKTAKTNDEQLGFMNGTINWHKHEVFLAEGERRIVVHRYWLRISPSKNKLLVNLAPAASWKGTVGHADYILHLAGGVTGQNVVYPKALGDVAGKYAIQPAGFEASQNQMRWTLDNFEPSEEISVELFGKKSRQLSRLRVSLVYADGNNVFEGTNLFDEDFSTAWAYGGPGKGEWLIAYFEKKRWIREVRIIPGYGQLESMYKYFNRPRLITVYFSDGTRQQFELKDRLEMQFLKVKPTQTQYVKIDVDSVYKGIYPDVTYISEIEFSDIASTSRIEPDQWKIGLEQASEVEGSSSYTLFDLITIAAAAAVFLLIGWQLFVLVRNRKKKEEFE